HLDHHPRRPSQRHPPVRHARLSARDSGRRAGRRSRDRRVHAAVPGPSLLGGAGCAAEAAVRRLLSIWLPLLAFALFLLFPFYWMVLTSIKPNDELVSVAANPFWVSRPTLDHVRYLLSSTGYPRWFWNTMAVAAAATALSICVSFFAAVALARLGFRGAETVSLGISLAYLIPPAILFIPLAEVLLKLGWFDRLWSVVPVSSPF